MRLMPSLQITIFNTFLFILFYLLITTIIAYFSNKEGFKRGSDRSWIGEKDKLAAYSSGYVFLGFIVSTVFVPINTDSNTFYIGLVVYVIAFVLSVYTNVCYVTAPLDKLITNGIYKYSRNPAYVCNSLLIVSIALISGAYLYFVFLLLFLVTSYFTVLVEEKYCMKEYGQEYKKYLEKTPRYLSFF